MAAAPGVSDSIIASVTIIDTIRILDHVSCSKLVIKEERVNCFPLYT